MDLAPYIERELVIATSHITTTDADLLNAAIDDGESAPRSIAVHDQAYGWTLQVPTSQPNDETWDHLASDGFSEALIGLLRIAHANHCVRLRLDRDADQVDELPTFTW